MKTSKYKGVSFIKNKKSTNQKKLWVAQIYESLKTDGYKYISYHETEREAAIAYDKKMIELGFEPVNILKRKS